MSTVQRLLRGSIFRTAELGVLLGATFFVTPLLVHSLGDRLYGFWALAGAFVGYYGLLDLGLSSAATRFLSQAQGRGDESELRKAGNTALYLFFVLGGLLAAATVAVALACPLVFRRAEEAALFRDLALLLGLTTAAGFPAKVYSAILMAELKHDAIALISIAKTLVYSAVLYAALKAGGGIMTVAALFSGLTLLQYGAIYLVARRKLRLSLAGRDRAVAWSMFRYGRMTALCQVGDILRFRLDSVLIAAFLSASLVTPYAVAVRLADGLGKLVLGCVGMMTPVFSRYEGRGDHEAIRSALLRVTKLSAILSAYVGLSVIFYAPAFISRWMGPGFEASVVVTALLCGGFVLGLPQTPGVQVLYGLSKHHIYAALSIGEGLLNLVFSLLFLKLYGLYGVALGTLASTAVFKLLIQPVYVSRAAGLTVRRYLVDAILVTLLKTAVPLAVYFHFIRGFVTADYPVIAACALAQTLLFAPVAYLFILDEDERRVISGAVWGLAAA